MSKRDVVAEVNAMTTDITPAERDVLDSLGVPPDALDASRPVDAVLLALVQQHVATVAAQRWVLDRPMQAAVDAWHRSQETFLISVQTVGEGGRPSDIQLFGPFHSKDAADAFGRECDVNGLSFEYWDPGFLTLTEKLPVQAPTVENLARHYDLYNPYEGLEDVVDPTE
jgi:hypothetical protein